MKNWRFTQYLLFFGFAWTLLGATGLLLWLVDRPVDNGQLTGTCGPIHWAPSDFPITVLIRSDALPWATEIITGMMFWEEETGLDLFELGPVYSSTIAYTDLREGPIAFVTSSTLSGRAITMLRWGLDCQLHGTWVRFPYDAPDDLTPRIARHELGHVLGLDHDTDESSVMYPKAMDDTMVRITNHDKELLKEAISGD